MNLFRITALYPSGHGRLVLRTELDWARDVEPTSVSGDATTFEVQANAPWIYFKLCWVSDDGFVWQPGTNRIAVPRPEGRIIYPTFFSGLTGLLSELQELEGVRFRVYRPAGYDENTLKRYPVLYMHDGANLFLPAESFLGTAWEADETLDTLHGLNVIDHVIVVGVHADDRMHRYTASGYDAYATWLADTLRPTLDARLRALATPETTAVMGSSLGGVLALHSAWTRPDVYGSAACLSSTFGVFDDLFARVAADPQPALRLYLDSGWPNDNFDRTVAMRDALLRRGFETGKDLLHFVFPGARHDETSWRSRVHLAFQWLFARPPRMSA